MKNLRIDISQNKFRVSPFKKQKPQVFFKFFNLVADVVKASIPFLAVLFVFLIMVTYIPWFSTYLPNSIMGPEIVIQ